MTNRRSGPLLLRRLIIGASILIFAPATHAELVAHWPLDEGSGTTAGDSIGINDGTLVNMGEVNWSADTPTGSGTALSFTGALQHVTLASQIFLRDTDAFTLSIWYRGTDTGTAGISGFGNWGKTLLGRDNNDIFANFGLANGYAIYSHFVGFPWVPESSNTFVADGLWHHIVFTNHPDQTGSLYIDGVPDNIGFSTAINDDNYSFRIDGFMRGYPDEFTTGTIDDIRIYDHALSAEQASTLYHGAPPVPLMNRAGWILLVVAVVSVSIYWQRQGPPRTKPVRLVS